MLEQGSAETWHVALDMINGGDMPPRRSPQFEDEDRMFVPPQRQVRMEVDLLELTIRFTSLAFECSRVTPLPEVFRKKKVYLFIAMNCKGDCVEILPK